jgi:DNA-binding MarR family transcriptional regulator
VNGSGLADFGTRVYIETVGTALHRAILAGERLRRQGAAEFGLELSDVMVIGHLFREGPLKPSQLSARTGMATGSMTALIDRLEAAHLAARRANPRDRRSHLIDLTDLGYRAAQALFAPLATAAATVIADLSESERDVVRTALDRLADALVTDPVPGWQPEAPRAAG